MRDAARIMSLSLAALFAGSGCGSSGNTCSQAAEHVAECTGQPIASPATCDPKQAAAALSMSCDELTARQAQGGRGLGFLCWLLPFTCPKAATVPPAEPAPQQGTCGAHAGPWPGFPNACACDAGYHNCNGAWTDGCESTQACGEGPGYPDVCPAAGAVPQIFGSSGQKLFETLVPANAIVRHLNGVDVLYSAKNRPHRVNGDPTAWNGDGLPTSLNGMDIQYDARGRIAAINGRATEYDAQDRLTSFNGYPVAYGASGPTSLNGKTVEWDAKGRPVSLNGKVVQYDDERHGHRPLIANGMLVTYDPNEALGCVPASRLILGLAFLLP